MQIQSIQLYNFRNYSSLFLNFNQNLNIIFGDNGSGKTNLVESIYTLALTKSFKTQYDRFLIKDDNELLNIAAIVKDKKINKYSISIDKNGKVAQIDGIKINKLSNYISNINIIMFSPDDIRIIKDAPSDRRKCLNVSISQINNKYLSYLNDYNKLIKQRNNYLKLMYVNKNTSQNYIELLTDKIIELGMLIYEERLKYINDINENIGKIYNNICRIKNLKLIYKSDFSNTNIEKLKKKYKKSLERDIILGKTTVGIHHDDYVFDIDGTDLKDYGSEGQQKNAIIAFKLSELNVVKQIKKKNPILILDDLFSELDKRKINNILKLIKKSNQVFITVTDLDKVNASLLETSKIFKVKNGKVEEYKYES